MKSTEVWIIEYQGSYIVSQAHITLNFLEAKLFTDIKNVRAFIKKNVLVGARILKLKLMGEIIDDEV